MQHLNWDGELLRQRLDALYGNTKWVTRFAKLIGVRRSTMYRYLKDEIVIPRCVWVVVVLLEQVEKAHVPMPELLTTDEYGGLKFPLPRLCAHCPTRALDEAEDAPLLRLPVPPPPDVLDGSNGTHR
jgi:hypothetical protein